MPDDTGYFEGQLVGWHEAINAADNHTMHAGRKAHILQIARIGRNAAHPVGDDNQSRVPQGIGQLFGEKGITLGLLQDQRRHFIGETLHAEALGGELQCLLG